MLLTITVLFTSFTLIQSQPRQLNQTEATLTISSRHRLLSDLYDRLGNLTPKIVRNRKDRKKIGELRDELTQQIARIKDQSFSEVPRKAQLVAEAIQMLHKYPVDVTTTVVAVTDEMVPNKKEQDRRQKAFYCKEGKYTRLRDTLSYMSNEATKDLVGSFELEKPVGNNRRRSGVLQRHMLSRNDRARFYDFNKMLREMKIAESGGKKNP